MPRHNQISRESVFLVLVVVAVITLYIFAGVPTVPDGYVQKSVNAHPNGPTYLVKSQE